MIPRFALLVALAECLLVTHTAVAAGNQQKTQQLIAVLRSDAALFDKARACQHLGEIGTKEAVPALAALLPDDHLSAYARSGLEGIPDPSAAEALRAATETVKGNLLAGVVNSLGALRDAESVNILRKLASDPASGVVKEALLALGRIATDDSIRLIRRALADGPESVRPDAAAACLLAAEKQLADGHAEVALVIYDAVRKANLPACYRAGATRGAILARKSDGVALLIEQLRSEDRVLRNAALTTIREIPSDTLAGALNAELERATPELQLQLLTALIDCHNPQSLQVIQAKAVSENPEIRRTALIVLGRIGGAAAAEALLKALAGNRSADESAIASSSLLRMEDSAVGDLVLKSLSTATDAGIRIRLIRLVESREMTNAVSELLRQTVDPEAKVAVAALDALRALAGSRELPALIAFARTCKDETSRDAAERAVCSLCTRTDASTSGGELVLAELKQTTEPTLKNAWIRILTCLGYAPALAAIIETSKDANDTVAANAIEQLGHWPDPSPIDTLFDVLQSDASAAQRKRALAAVIRLAATAAEEHQRPDDVVIGWLQRAAEVAQSVEDKRLIVSCLGRLKTMESFRLLRPYLEEPGLGVEAAAAIVQIVPALSRQEDASVIKEALERIVATVNNADIRSQAAKFADSIPNQSRPLFLFDRRSLAGWEGDTNTWCVRDGVIVGGSMAGNPRNEFLATVRDFTNFVLRLEYKLVGSEGFVNSGVQFRSVRVKQPPNEMSGFQADIGAGHSGCLYDESRRDKFLARAPDDQIKRLEKPGQWNRYEVRCAGPRIQIVLNGEKTVDYTETDAAIAGSGRIALQIHGGCKAEISFRDITLQSLSYAVANREFGLAKTNWKILSFSSENTQVEDERALLAIDGNPDTFWHTQWSGAKPNHPHHLAIDLGQKVEMTGFTYLPRQDGRQVAGVIGDYEFYASRDGKDWGQAVAQGRFERIDLDPSGRVVILDEPIQARYIKLVSLNAPGGQPYAGAAEIGVLGRAPEKRLNP